MHRIFVYGTLRHPPLRRAVLGRDVPSVPGSLVAHRVAPLRGRPYPGLVFDPGASAIGDLIDVDDGELAVLDEFEGPQYARTTVVVDIRGGTAGAEVYLFEGQRRHEVEDGVWSFDHFVEHEAPRWPGGG